MNDSSTTSQHHSDDAQAKMASLITVLIPTYDRARFLPDAIASAIVQTHANIEIVVLDDASPDSGRTEAAVAPFVASDPRVRYVRHATNLGITGNWRAGIAMVQGEYFCLLHDDDTFEPDFIAKLVAAIDGKHDVILSFCDHWIMETDGTRNASEADHVSALFGRSHLAAGVVPDFAKTALVDGAVCAGAALYRRADVLPEFAEEAARGSVDIWLMYRCVSTGRRAVYVPERLMNYRSHGGGMSHTRHLYMTAGHLYRYQRILADPQLKTIHPTINSMRGQALGDYGIYLLAAGRRAEAAFVLREATGRKGTIGRCLARAGPLGVAAVRLTRRLRGLSKINLDPRLPDTRSLL